MASPFTAPGADMPVLAAPMAGGPATPWLVTAVARAGSADFLAGGYKTPDALAEQIAKVRRDAVLAVVAVITSAAGDLAVQGRMPGCPVRPACPTVSCYRSDGQ